MSEKTVVFARETAGYLQEYRCPGERELPGRDHHPLGDVMAFGTYHVVGSV